MTPLDVIDCRCVGKVSSIPGTYHLVCHHFKCGSQPYCHVHLVSLREGLGDLGFRALGPLAKLDGGGVLQVSTW